MGASALFLAIFPAHGYIGTGYQLQLGNPSNATADTNNHDHYLIQRTVEALDYSDNLGEPVWASWDLTPGDIGSSGRSGSFFTDTNLPPDFYEVTDTDYNGVGSINFNRGHLCPSEDRTDNTTDNDLVFFMSNIMPQAANNNQGVWGNLENDCRSFAQAGNELLIFCGPSGFGPNRIPSGKAVIADYTWKIAVVVPSGTNSTLNRINAATRVIAVKIPNNNSVTTAWQSYVTNAAQIEADTGFKFFTALPAPVASALRYKVDGQTAPAPVISNFSPASGTVGSSVVITGTNFGSALSVSFNGMSAAYSVDSAGQITAQVPTNATAGHISVATASGVAASSGNFTPLGVGLQGIQTVFIILMENHNWSEIKGSASAPYINNTLLPMASHAEQYYNPPGIHPSLPNYLWLEAGTNYGIADDNDPAINHQGTTNHLVAYLRKAGISWTSYQEDISSNVCPLTSVNLYAPKHNPMVYFDDVTSSNSSSSAYCIANVHPFSELASDLSSNAVTHYNFITPNLCDDMHNASCGTGDSIRNGDNWLAANLPAILNSQAYSNNGVVFVTWDESETGDGPIGMIVLSPLAKSGYSNAVHYTHSSTLRTIQEIFNVTPFLGDAVNATDLSALFNLNTPSLLSVSPAAGLTSSGPVGGPFTPGVQNYVLTNTGGIALNWTASSLSNWLTVLPMAGTLTAGSNITVTVSINTNANALAGGAYADTVSFSNTSTGAGSTTRAVNLTVAGSPTVDLGISATHSGSFTQGDAADVYSIIVTNLGTLASSGTITVTDALPAGLTATAISGSGWTTNLATLTCTRSDSLAAGASYPPITITVSVATNAPALVTNAATVSGGGDANVDNNVANDPTAINTPGGVTGVLAGWNMNGLTAYGPSPFAPTNIAANLTVVGLTRAAGIGTSGTAAARAWGGNDFVDTTSALAISNNHYATFTITANNGYKVSFGAVSPFNYRRSGTGPISGLLQYRIGAGAFSDIATVSYSVSTSGGASLGPIDLSGIDALQNIGAGTNVTFRIVNWGATGSTGTWYIYDMNTNAALDFAVQGTVTSALTLTPIQSWRQQWFGTAANSGAAADTAIATSDGMPNLLKYALGLNPFTPATNPVVGDISTGYLRLTSPKNPNATDVSFFVELSSALPGQSWTTNGTIIDQNTSTLLQAHDAQPIHSSTNGYLRLRVSDP
ncbi:MAG: Nuclease [Pedosphaera sp.]|nr:Nuclease [Pedosphaera sp.]